jgi:acyl-CoA-binding protein
MHDPLSMLSCSNSIPVDITIPTITMESVVTHSNVMSPQYILHRASIMAKNLPPSIQPNQQALLRVSPSLRPDSIILTLQMYAYHKQGSIGDNPDPRPSKPAFNSILVDFKLMNEAETDPVELAKWDMWKGMKGLNKEAASRRYVSTLQEVSVGTMKWCSAHSQVLQASDASEAKRLLGQLQALSASGLPK